MRSGVLPPAGPHGGDGARVAAALGVDVSAVLDLSASMNPVAPDPRPVVARHLDALGRYPDPGPATATLAAAMGVDPLRLLLTNGGAEAIALVAAETGPGWADACDFSLYRRHLPALDPAGPRWCSDPHNPLGTLAGPDAMAEVWDEAFYPLATGRWTAGRPGFALGSLTKLLACPGLRIGYVVAPDARARDRLAARQPRWAVNGLACAALPDLLATVDLVGWAVAVASHRTALTAVLVAAGLDVRPGATANWVLVDGAPDLRDRLARHSIVVRDCTSFGLPGTHRVAVPRPQDLARLAAALAGSAARPAAVAAP
ncbi:MAG: aminotransferase class I/II-fold pyridoxal phosphate-dependent enzyme [Acidimicrobiales bacterium]